MIKAGTINPLNVHNLRKVQHCPPHFIKVPFDLRAQERKIIDWVEENLEGRYHFAPYYEDKARAGVSVRYYVAFENHNEASYFALYLNLINS